GFLDFGNGGDGQPHPNYTRTIFWESTVYLLPSPNPELVVNSAGVITTLTNVTVHDCTPGGSCSGPLSVGDPIATGDTISVDDIINSNSAQVLFEANTGVIGGTQANNNSLIWGNDGLFQIQHTWDYVKLLNNSDRPMVVHNINVVNLTAAATVTID